jgi:hypothetical protein
MEKEKTIMPPTPSKTNLYKKEAKRKNSIVDNILSRQQDMQ